MPVFSEIIKKTAEHFKDSMINMSNSISLPDTCPLVKLHLYLFYTSVFEQIKQARRSMLFVSMGSEQ